MKTVSIAMCVAAYLLSAVILALYPQKKRNLLSFCHHTKCLAALFFSDCRCLFGDYAGFAQKFRCYD